MIFLAGSGGPASRARFGAPHISFDRSWCALCLFGPHWPGLPRLWLLLGLFFSFFLSYFFYLFPFPPLVAPPLCPALRVFRPRVAWALASCRPPPTFFSPSPPLCAPCGLLLFVFSDLGALEPWRLVAPPPPPRFFLFPPLLLSVAFPAFRLPWASAPPPFFVFFVSPSFCAGCAVRGGFVRLWLSGVPACVSVVLSLLLLCVRWLVLFLVGCWALLSCAVSLWVFVSCFGGAVLVWSRGSPPCGLAWCVLVFRCPVLCSVALCCRVMVC